jgi:hypothetical protein
MASNDIRKANKAYEDWLRDQLHGDIVKDDLSEKHEKMSDGPFPFLRATYWRWAETILTVCPALAGAPPALSVGDIHLENYGTWRDVDGRLIWGVNDVDEAAEMPYVLDIVRLATSAALARTPRQISTKDICAGILAGYRDGLKQPRPYTLDGEHPWLRKLVVVPDTARKRFWEKLDKLKEPAKPPPRAYVDALKAAMPDPNIAITIRPRTAGTGSLGRPRWVGFGEWRGGRVVREAKALVTSGWVRASGQGAPNLRCKEIALGSYRAPDPWYDVIGTIAVRRLSPNSRKIEVKDMGHELLRPQMLRTMGHELASVHLGTGNRAAAITADFKDRDRGWLRDATDAASDFVRGEFDAWRKG